VGQYIGAVLAGLRYGAVEMGQGSSTVLSQIAAEELGLPDAAKMPEEIGPLAVYLASNASRYMTGAEVVIDGRRTQW
jgi:NAD(P)-dependent dehydrogenase (short-subunit alcohol dehydrogenase family)